MDDNEKLMWQAVRALGIDVPILSWSVKSGVGDKSAEVTLRLMYGGVHVWKAEEVAASAMPKASVAPEKPAKRAAGKAKNA